MTVPFYFENKVHVGDPLLYVADFVLPLLIFYVLYFDLLFVLTNLLLHVRFLEASSIYTFYR